MKVLNVLVFFILSLFLFASCQKELNFENIDAIGTLKSDTAHDCLPSSVYGEYITDSILTSANYIEVQVNVAATGLYDIKSDTINGYSFKGTGSFDNVGLNTVKVYGTGKPLNPGLNQFTIYYDTSSCKIDINVDVPGGDAEYALASTTGTCTGATLSGTYMQGFATTSSNTAALSVSVTTIGNYTISTTEVNGVTFSATGAFTATGAQTVTLTASGTPAAEGSFNYPVSANGSNCAFSVTYVPAAPAATFTLGAVAGTCTGAGLNGIYQVGLPSTTSNTVTLSVVVTVPGTYNIISTAQNGVVFSGSGVFTTATTQVVLTAIGTPVVAGPFNFDVSDGVGTCSFSVTFTGAVTDFITCKLDGIASTFNAGAAGVLITSGGSPVLTIQGQTSAGTDPMISFMITRATGTIDAAIYTTNQFADEIFLTCNYNDAASVPFFAGTDPANQTTNPPAFTITVTSITANRIEGTFSGSIGTNDGAGPDFIAVTEGAFSVAY